MTLATCGTALPAVAEGLVHLRDVDPSIRQDIRYATANNFTGRPVPGYEAGECLLLAGVAKALAAVQRDLAQRGLSLKVYDCYRPRRAVAAFWAWARDDDEASFSPRHHPRIERSRLHGLGYIARSSTHAQGISVDLTLVALSPASKGEPDPRRLQAPCHLAPLEKGPDASLDMGTAFDCFDIRSQVGAPGLEPAQREARLILRDAMERQGFAGYAVEWWHFTHMPSAAGARSLDIPVRRPAR